MTRYIQIPRTTHHTPKTPSIHKTQYRKKLLVVAMAQYRTQSSVSHPIRMVAAVGVLLIGGRWGGGVYVAVGECSVRMGEEGGESVRFGVGGLVVGVAGVVGGGGGQGGKTGTGTVAVEGSNGGFAFHFA